MLLAVVFIVVVVVVLRRSSSASPPPPAEEKPPVKQNPQTGSDRGPDANQLLGMGPAGALAAVTIGAGIEFSNWYANTFDTGRSGHPIEKGAATTVGTAGALAGLGAGFGVADAAGYSGIVAAVAAGSFVPVIAIVVVAAVVIAETLAIIGIIEDANYIAAYDAAFAEVQALYDAGDLWGAWDKAVYYSTPVSQGATERADGGPVLVGLGWRGGGWAEEIRTNNGTSPRVTQVMTFIVGLTDAQAMGYGFASAKDMFDTTAQAIHDNQPWMFPGHIYVHFGKRFGYAGTQKSTDWPNAKAIADMVKQLRVEVKGAR